MQLLDANLWNPSVREEHAAFQARFNAYCSAVSNASPERFLKQLCDESLFGKFFRPGFGRQSFTKRRKQIEELQESFNSSIQKDGIALPLAISSTRYDATSAISRNPNNPVSSEVSLQHGLPESKRSTKIKLKLPRKERSKPPKPLVVSATSPLSRAASVSSVATSSSTSSSISSFSKSVPSSTGAVSVGSVTFKSTSSSFAPSMFASAKLSGQVDKSEMSPPENIDSLDASEQLLIYKQLFEKSRALQTSKSLCFINA